MTLAKFQLLLIKSLWAYCACAPAGTCAGTLSLFVEVIALNYRNPKH